MSLEDVAVIQTGVSKSDSRAILDAIEVPYLRVANVQDGYVELGDLKTIRLERTQLQRYALREGDVLLTEGGDADKLGRGCVWAGQAAPCVHQNHVFVVRTAPGNLLPEFLSRQTGTTYGRAYFKACSKQTTNLASINSSQVKQYPVLLPPIGEQRQIVEALSTWDRAIQLAEQLLTLKERRKRALMGQLLTGKRRLPKFGHSTARYRTFLGSAPRDWAMRSFGEFLKESRDLCSDGQSARKLTIRLYGKGVVERVERRTGSKSTRYYRRTAGQFIYSKLDFLNGAFGLVPDLLTGFESTLDLPAFDVSQKLNSTYLLALVKWPVFYTRCVGYGMGGRKARRVPPEQFLSIEFPCPSLAEQNAIVRVIEACEMEIRQAQSQVYSLKRQRLALMQKLLTGEVRVHK